MRPTNMNRFGIASCGIATVMALTIVSPAYGQQPARDPAAADALFREAREAMKKGDHAAACPKFAESQRLDPAPGTVLNLAQCEEKSGRIASAVAHYREAAEQFPAGDPRIALAQKSIADLEKVVPRLTLRLAPEAPEGTTITRDAVELGSGSFGVALPIDPGEHVITTRAPGRKERRQVITIGIGERKEVVAELGDPLQVEVPVAPAVSPTPSAAQAPVRPEPKRVERAAPDRPRSEPESGSNLRTGLLWTGGALLGFGAISGVAALAMKSSFEDQCDGSSCYPEARDDWQTGKNMADLSTGTLLTGAVLLGVGLLLPNTRPAANITSADRSRLVLTGRF